MKKIKSNNKRSSYTVIVLILIVCLGIGYAALTTSLKIRSTLSLSRIEFAIHFDNVGTLANSAVVTQEAQIKENTDKKEIEFVAGLTRLDDYYAFTTDIVNEGSIPGKIVSIELSGLSDSQKRLINYDVRYTSTNKKVAIGDYFGPNSTKNITVKVIYELADDVEDTDLPTDIATMDLVFSINFENGTLTEYKSRAASSKLMQDTNYMNSSSLTFTNSTSSLEHEGAYVLNGTENNDFPIYFYRGGHVNTKNNVIFGGYCWRIIRTTNTGGIKIIYNGVPNENGECVTTSGDSTSISNVNFGSSRYGNSTVRMVLESWYFDNLISYQGYLEDTCYCNDQNYNNGNVDISCSASNAVEYSLSNNNIAYPVGIITAEEATLCGMSTNISTYSWLNTGKVYWTNSHNGRYPDSANSNWVVTWEGNLNKVGDGYGGDPFGVRPVVSLNSETELYEGDGSQSNPFKVR